MIKVKIENREEDLEKIDERWIIQQINRRKDEGVDPCVEVKMRLRGVDMILSTPSCSVSGSTRKATYDEMKYLELWKRHRLNTQAFNGGDLVAFLKQIRE